MAARAPPSPLHEEMLITYEDNAESPSLTDLCLSPHTDPPQSTSRHHRPKEFSLCGEDTIVIKEEQKGEGLQQELVQLKRLLKHKDGVISELGKQIQALKSRQGRTVGQYQLRFLEKNNRQLFKEVQRLQQQNERLRKAVEASEFTIREQKSQNEALRKTNATLMREASQLLSMEKKERSMVSKVRQIVAEQCQQDSQQLRSTSYRRKDSFETPVVKSFRKNVAEFGHSLRGTKSVELTRRNKRHASSSKHMYIG